MPRRLPAVPRRHRGRGRLAAVVALSALAQLVGGPGPAGRAGTAVQVEPIYRLRVTIATSASAARLFLRTPSIMIDAEATRVSPGDRGSFLGYGRGPLVLNNRNDGLASASFEVAVTPGGARRLRFTSVRRGRGDATVSVQNLNRRPPEDIRSVRQTGGARRSFALDAGRVAARGPVPGTDPLPPEVYAFYYVWYQLGDWTGGRPIASYNVNPDPYDSSDPAEIDEHIQQAMDAGIDGFIVSWQGSGTATDDNLKVLVDRLPAGFGFAVYIEILYPAFTSEENLIAQIEYALDTYATDPNYVRYRGTPLLYVFASRHPLTGFGGGVHPHAMKVWQRVIDAVRADGYDFFLVGEGRHFKADNFALFQGMHPYGTEDPAGTWDFNRSRGLMARAYAVIHGGVRRFYAASVIPGYDDRHISGRRNNYYFPHNDGQLYDAQWAAATGTTADQALVVTFNEWLETTQIEPNELWGEKYLDLTAQYAAAFKASR